MADQVLTKQKLINADEDLGDLEEVLNGPPGKIIKTRLGREVYTLASVPQINTMTREEVAAAVAPKANKADVDEALSNLSTNANKFYPTLAEANYYITQMAVNDVVTVGEEANKGLWYKATAEATSLTKSPFDPVEIAKADATTKANAAKKEALNQLIDRSSNLFNKNSVLLNTSIETDGTIVSDALRWLSDYIPVEPASTFTMTDASYRIAVFDANKNFLQRSGVAATGGAGISYAVSGNTYFVRLSATTLLASMQLNSGSILLPYEPYFLEVKKDLLSNIPPEKLPTVSPEMTDFFDRSSNLFNKNSVLLNTSIETDGTIVSDALRWLSDYIPCTSGQVFSLTNGSYRVAYFDENKNFITLSGITSDKLTALSNGHIRYIRLSSTVSADALMLNTGETLLPYESFDNARLQRKYASKILDSDLPVISPTMTDFFKVSPNLFNKETITPNTSIETTGVIVPDTMRWLSDYIPVEPASTFTMTDASYRIAVFDANKNFLQRSGVAATGGAGISYAVSGNTYFVRLSSTKNIDEVMVNKGATILPLDKYGDVKIGLEYLPEQPVVPDVDIDQIADQVQQRIGSGLNWEPSFPKLNFSIVESGTWRIPMWMSSDGEVIYGAYGGQLLQSTDEWTTRVQIGTSSLPKAIAGIRTLEDGELLISTNRDEATATNSKVYKTIGYDRNNPSAATFKEVLTTAASQANINNRWGLTVYQNICTASDYGLRGENGAQNVYLSTDYGETWRLIFNLRTQVVEGRPPLTDSAHMHTVAYDPYYNRIWVCTGDNPNTATYYSDDLGETWTFVVGSTEVQYTGIIALPDAVVFGSDRAPNGVFAYHRKDRSEMPVIKPLFLINDSPTITHVFALPFKKDWLPNTPVYFAGNKTTESVNDKPVIMGFVDGKKAHLLYEHSSVDALETALGPTAQGNIISSYSTTGVAGQVIIKGQAPTWQKL